MARRCPLAGLRGGKSELDVGNLPGRELGHGHREAQHPGPAGLQVNGLEVALGHHLAVHGHGPARLQPSQASEGLLVGHPDRRTSGVNGLKSHRLQHHGHLQEDRVGCAVRGHQAVHAEGPVVGRITEVPAVGEALGSIRLALPEGLVGPVPGEAALQPWGLANGLPVAVKAST